MAPRSQGLGSADVGHTGFETAGGVHSCRALADIPRVILDAVIAADAIPGAPAADWVSCRPLDEPAVDPKSARKDQHRTD